MTSEEKEKLMKKWDHLIDHNLINNDILGNTKVSDLNNNSFDNIVFPLVRQATTQTMGMNLVSVQPMHMGPSEEVKSEVKSINRERKIEAITDDKDFEEMKVEEHPDYRGSLNGKVFYMDFIYGSTSSNP